MIRTPIQRLFDWKIRGIRWMEIIGLVCVAAMVLSVYVAKAAAARESAAIGQMERDIAETSKRVRLLRAEVASLEEPVRLEGMSRQAGLAPTQAGHRTELSDLATLNPGSSASSLPTGAETPAIDAPVLAEPAEGER